MYSIFTIHILTLSMLFISIVYIVVVVRAQIPAKCGTNFTSKTGVCCPLSAINGQVCGFPERGICEEVQIHKEEIETFGFKDIRYDWPKQWFKYLCKCKAKYFGSSCDECWYGWKGDNCTQRQKIVRGDVLRYNKTEKELFVNVMAALREEESPYLLVKEAYRDMEESVVSANIHEVLVNIHFLAQRSIITPRTEQCENTQFIDFAHANVGFVTFHRHFILLWERWSADVAKRRYGIVDFAFPYWDWTDKTSCEICTDDLIGGQGEPSAEGSFQLSSGSPFHSWMVYCDLFSPKSQFSVNNCAPCSASSQSSTLTRKMSSSMFPTSEHVRFTLSRKFYAQTSSYTGNRSYCPFFTKSLEGVCGRRGWNLKHTMHNAVHNDVVGAFSESSTSPNDPLFVLHHTQIDRLFQIWWLSHPASSKEYPSFTAPGHCLLCNQVGFIPAVTHKQMFVDSRELGYEYDSHLYGQ